jgi:hypothetical protein
MKDSSFLILLVTALVLITLFVSGVIFLRLFYYTDEKAIADWAKKNNFTVLQTEARAFSESPFSKLSFDSDQKVYLVTLKDSAGNIQKGWIRCHGLEKTLIMDRVEFIKADN